MDFVFVLATPTMMHSRSFAPMKVLVVAAAAAILTATAANALTFPDGTDTSTVSLRRFKDISNGTRARATLKSAVINLVSVKMGGVKRKKNASVCERSARALSCSTSTTDKMVLSATTRRQIRRRRMPKDARGLAACP